MEVGFFNLMTLKRGVNNAASIIRDTEYIVDAADDLGFDCAWFAEHHFSNHSICPSPLSMVNYFAGRTKRIGLGPSVIVLPLYEPIRLIEDITFSSQLSRGRLRLGFGAGYQPHEFENFTIPLADKHRVFVDKFALIREWLTTGTVRRGDNAIPFTVPLHQEFDKIFLVSAEPALLEQLAGDHAIVPMIGPPRRGGPTAQNTAEHINRLLSRALRSPVAVQRYIYLTESKDERDKVLKAVRSLARRGFQMRKSQPERDDRVFIREEPLPNEPELEGFSYGAYIGPPDEVIPRLLADTKALNVTHLSCFTHMEGLDARSSVKAMESFIGHLRQAQTREAA